MLWITWSLARRAWASPRRCCGDCWHWSVERWRHWAPDYPAALCCSLRHQRSLLQGHRQRLMLHNQNHDYHSDRPRPAAAVWWSAPQRCCHGTQHGMRHRTCMGRQDDRAEDHDRHDATMMAIQAQSGCANQSKTGGDGSDSGQGKWHAACGKWQLAGDVSWREANVRENKAQRQLKTRKKLSFN